MNVTEILQQIKKDTEHLLRQLGSAGSRLYEISTAGTIVERTSEIREHYQSVLAKLQHALGTLNKN